MRKMNVDDMEALLKGTTWKVYKYILKNGPTGIRDVQRSLKLSTPSLVLYHINKLERTGIVKKCKDGYVADQIFLRNRIKVRKLLIPTYFFYSLFMIAALVVQLLIFRPRIISRDYAFSVVIMCIILGICVYETVKTIVKRNF